jgi:nitroreductase
MSVVLKRTSVRQYQDKKVPREIVKKLLVAAMQAPSAHNQQPWKFIVIENKNRLKELSKASKGAYMLKDAPLAIVVVMKDGGSSPLMKAQDCAAATENILIEAVEHQLGAVWIGVYPLEERMNHVNEILHIKNGTAFCQIAIGYPKEEPIVKLRYDESRVYFEEMN